MKIMEKRGLFRFHDFPLSLLQRGVFRIAIQFHKVTRYGKFHGSIRCSENAELYFPRAALATLVRKAFDPGLLTECFTRMSTGLTAFP